MLLNTHTQTLSQKTHLFFMPRPGVKSKHLVKGEVCFTTSTGPVARHLKDLILHNVTDTGNSDPTMFRHSSTASAVRNSRGLTTTLQQ